MTGKILLTFPDKCVGCRLCEQWCSWQHDQAVRPARARLNLQPGPHGLGYLPLACDHCAEAPCMAACPTEAISRHPQTGGLLLDEALCLECAICQDSCLNGSLRLDPETQFPLLCDLCGGDPACVRHCPEGAILYVDPGYLESAAHAPVEGWLWQKGARLPCKD